MSPQTDTEHPPDICLLLRVHAEQRWLANKVLPILRQLELPGAVEEDDIGSALAYLEVLWLEARLRAAETEAAFAKLDQDAVGSSLVVVEKARRYHAALRRLRASTARRIRGVSGPVAELPSQEAANS